MMFPMRFSSSSFYTFSGSEKKEALQNISFVHVFFQKKDEDLCHFQSGTFRIFFRDFPHTWRIQALQPRRRWKNLTVKAPRTCCAKVWWLSTVGYPKPKPTLPGTITYHHISQAGKLGGKSSTQKWDTGDILSIPLSHPNYQLRYWYRHFLTYRPIVFGT